MLAAQAIVLDKELHYFRGEFPILVRRPAYVIAYTGSLTPWPALGLHDDYYDSSATDAGTFIPAPGLTAAALRSYAAAEATTAMFAGEFGALDPAMQSCAALDAYSRQYHVQSISLNLSPPGLGPLLIQEGCATGFYNKVGTRIELQRATIAGVPKPGGQLSVTLKMANTGYGRVIRARPASLALLDGGGALIARIAIPLAALDLRRLGKASIAYRFTVTLPDRLLSGPITMALLIPDPAPSLTAQAAYALPMNSVNREGQAIFDPATGYNIIGAILFPRRAPDPL